MARKSDIRLRRSAVSGSVPSTTDLNLGELAINTYDGKLFLKKDVSGTETVVEVGGNKFGTIAVSGQSDVVADSANDTLTFAAGSGMTITTDASTDTVTLTASSSTQQTAIWKEYVYTATTNQTSFSGSDDNSQTLSYVAGYLQVFLNGVLLDNGTDYTATNGTTVTLVNGAASGDLIQIATFVKVLGSGDAVTDEFTGDGNTAAYTLSADPDVEDNTMVFIDGVYQEKGTYTVSGTTLTFDSNVPNGASIEVVIGSRNVTVEDVQNLTVEGDLTVEGESVFTGIVTAQDEFVGDLDGAIQTTIRNTSGSTIYKGQAVYVTGLSGNTPTVALAKANSASTMPAVGILRADINNNASGQMTVLGTLEGIDTSGSNNIETGVTLSINDVFYVSATEAGKITNVAPTGESNLIQNLGTAIRVSPSTNMTFSVKGAGRTNATPNLNSGNIFYGNGSNQSVSTTLDTSIVPESGNLYYTDARVESYLDGGTSTPTFSSANITNTSTGDSLLITTTEDSSSAAPVITLKRNSGSPADADYLGQLKFKGENDADQEVVYAKITSKIQDASDGSEDGLIEFANRKAGSNVITARLRSDSLQLLNGTGLEVAGDATITGNLTVDGTTTTLNTATLDVEDKNITLNYGSGDTSASADGAGITIQDAVNSSTDATILWDGTNDEFDFSHNISAPGLLNGAANSFLYLSGGNASNAGSNILLYGQSHASDANATVFRAGGTETMRITSSGNVGIGTNSPGELLEVKSDGSNADGAVLLLKHANNNTTDVLSTIKFANNAGSIGTIQAGTAGSNATGYITFNTDITNTSAERMRIHTNGNIGIGTTSPAEKLEVNGNIKLGDGHLIGNDSTDNLVINSSSAESILLGSNQHIFFNTGATSLTSQGDTRMFISATGNVGIGTSSPTAKLDVQGDGADIFLQSDDFKIARIQPRGTGADLDKGLLSLFDGSTEDVRIDTAGNSWFNGGPIGIGTVSPGVSLDVGSKTDAIRVPNGTTAQRPTAALGQLRYNTTTSEFEGYADGAWGKIGGGGDSFGTIAVSGQSNVVAEQENDTLTLVGTNGVSITTDASTDTVTIDGRTSYSPFTTDLFTTANATTTDFVLSVTPSSEDNLIVFLEGVYQNKNSYTLSSNTLTLDSAPGSGEEVVVHIVSDLISGQALVRNNFTGDNSTTDFTLTIAPMNENNTFVYSDGVYQEKSEYSISGTTLSFTTAPATGDSIEVIIPKTTELQQPAVGSIDDATMYDTTVLIPQTVTATTVASTSATTIATHAAATYRTIKYLVQCTQGTDYHSTEINLIHDGTTVYITEYGTLFDNASLGTFNATISGGNILLQITAGSATSMAVKVMSSAIPV